MRYNGYGKLSLDTAVVGDIVAAFVVSRESNAVPSSIAIGTITKITPSRRDITVEFPSGKQRVYNRFGGERHSGGYNYSSTVGWIELLDSERHSVLLEDIAYFNRVTTAKRKLRMYADALDFSIDPLDLNSVEVFIALIDGKGLIPGKSE